MGPVDVADPYIAHGHAIPLDGEIARYVGVESQAGLDDPFSRILIRHIVELSTEGWRRPIKQAEVWSITGTPRPEDQGIHVQPSSTLSFRCSP
jgi:hypothetical protein